MSTSGREIQADIWSNKVANGFNTTDVPMEVCLLMAEVAEFFEAWKRGREESLGEELADIAIFTYGLSEMVGVDLDKQVRAKAAANSGRVYIATLHGHVEEET